MLSQKNRYIVSIDQQCTYFSDGIKSASSLQWDQIVDLIESVVCRLGLVPSRFGRAIFAKPQKR